MVATALAGTIFFVGSTSRRPGEGVPLPAAHDGAVRHRLPADRAGPRPGPQRPPLDDHRHAVLRGPPLLLHDPATSTTCSSTPRPSSCSCWPRATRWPGRRSCPPWSQRRRAGRGQLQAVADLGRHGLRGRAPAPCCSSFGGSSGRSALATISFGARRRHRLARAEARSRRPGRRRRARPSCAARRAAGGVGHGPPPRHRRLPHLAARLSTSARTGCPRGTSAWSPACQRARRARRLRARAPRSRKARRGADAHRLPAGGPRLPAVLARLSATCPAPPAPGAVVGVASSAGKWPSTRSSSATPPTPTGAGPSPSSRPASRSSGWSAPCSGSSRCPRVGFLIVAATGFAGRPTPPGHAGARHRPATPPRRAPSAAAADRRPYRRRCRRRSPRRSDPARRRPDDREGP